MLYCIRRLCTCRSVEAVVIFLFDFGGPLQKSFQGLVICWSLYSATTRWYRLLQRSHQLTILFSLPCGCGPWGNTVSLKCRHPHSLAQSSYRHTGLWHPLRTTQVNNMHTADYLAKWRIHLNNWSQSLIFYYKHMTECSCRLYPSWV